MAHHLKSAGGLSASGNAAKNRNAAVRKSDAPAGLVRLLDADESLRGLDWVAEPIAGLPFSFTIKTPRGRWLRECHFAVPAEAWAQGPLTGHKVAEALFQSTWSKDGPASGFRLIDYLAEVGIAHTEARRGPSRYYAAHALLGSIADLLVGVVATPWCDAVLRSRFDRAASNVAFITRYEAQRRAEIVARLQAGRRAKAARTAVHQGAAQ
jgi:hypothetical protein